MLIAGSASAASFTQLIYGSSMQNGGYVTDGASITINHTFDPDDVVLSVQKVYLGVMVADDWRECTAASNCYNEWKNNSEIAVAELDGAGWKSGSASYNIFGGDVTALVSINEAGDGLQLVMSGPGDYRVKATMMYVSYTSGGVSAESVFQIGNDTPTNAIPEPSAALVFLLGGLTLSGRIRHGRR